MVRCLDVLGALSPRERGLIRIVVEVVQESRDCEGEGGKGGAEKEGDGEADEADEDDATPSAANLAKALKPPKQLSPEEQGREDALDSISMLERVNGYVDCVDICRVKINTHA